VTNKLIKELSTNLKPVNPICKSSKFFAWGGIVLVFTLILLSFLGVRSNSNSVFTSPLFWIESFLILVLMVGATKAAISLCNPGKCRYNVIAFFVPLLLFLGLVFSKSGAGFSVECMSFHCIGRGLLFSVFPLVTLFLLSRGNYSTNPKRFVFFLALSNGLVGTLILHFICSNSLSTHVLLSHVVPAFFLAFILTICSGFILRKL
jgi:hypothetical protein